MIMGSRSCSSGSSEDMTLGPSLPLRDRHFVTKEPQPLEQDCPVPWEQSVPAMTE